MPNPLKNFLITAALSSSLFALFYLPLEFLITQVLLVTPAPPKFISLLLILALIFLLDSIDWQQCLTTKFKVIFTLLLLAGASTALLYRRYALPQKTLPKIYRLSRNHGIQGHRIEITGVNFGAADQAGKLFLGDQDIVVHSWDNDKIVFYLPVPRRYGPTPLYLVTNEGRLSNKVTFRIDNPHDWSALSQSPQNARGRISTKLLVPTAISSFLALIWAAQHYFQPKAMVASLKNGLEQTLNLFVNLIT